MVGSGFQDQLAEVGVVGFGDDCLAQAQAAGDEQTAAFLFDNNADAADVAGVFDVDVTTYELGSFGQFQGVVIELAGGTGLHVAGARGVEFCRVDIETAFFLGEVDADVVFNDGVRFSIQCPVNVDGCRGNSCGVGFLAFGHERFLVGCGKTVF